MHNEKHSSPEFCIMKKHLTLESNYIPSVQALGPPWSGANQRVICARVLCQSNDYYFKAEVRRGLLGKREWGTKSLYNNNQVRRHGRLNEMQQTSEALFNDKSKR